MYALESGSQCFIDNKVIMFSFNRICSGCNFFSPHNFIEPVEVNELHFHRLLVCLWNILG